MKKFSFLILSLLLGLVACTKDDASKPRLRSQGTASGGGGGYGNESGKRLLKLAKDELALMLLQASDDNFTELEKEVSKRTGKKAKAELVRLVRELKEAPSEDVVRDGLRLKFNYNEQDPKKPFIYATQLFFDSTASFAVDFVSFELIRQQIHDTQIKILHEAFHVLGFGRTKETDGEAREMARRTFNSLWSENLYCQSEEFELPAEESSQAEGYDRKSLKLGFAINLPSGFGYRFQSLNFPEGLQEIESIVSTGEKNLKLVRLVKDGNFLSPHLNYDASNDDLLQQFAKSMSLNSFEYCASTWKLADLANFCKVAFTSTEQRKDQLLLKYSGPLRIALSDSQGVLYAESYQKVSQILLNKSGQNLFAGVIQARYESAETGTLASTKHNLTCRRTQEVIQTNLKK